MKGLLSKVKLNKIKFSRSVVALLLSLVLFTSTTYSWLDSIFNISIVTPTTLTLDSIDKCEFAVDLDSTNTLNLGDYFNTAGNMHLTACSSDGNNFYFKTDKSTYRRGTANDVNVNYISCTFKVKAPSDNILLWFDSVPTLKIGSNDVSNYLRYAITVDNEMTVFSKTGNSYTCISSTVGEKKAVTPEEAASYVANQGTESLLAVEGNKTKTVNIKMWLENPQYATATESFTVTNRDSLTLTMNLKATADKKIIYFSDNTFNESGIRLLTTSNDSENNKNFYWCVATDLDKNGSFSFEGDGKYKAEIPATYASEELYILRTNGTINTGSNTLTVGTASVKYNYKWKVTIPDDANTYSVVGSRSKDGYWEDAVQIYCDDQFGLDTLKTMYAYDSDKSQGSNMYYDGVKGYWTGYVYASSTEITFTHNGTDKWAYTGDNKQLRPATSYTYTIYDYIDGTWEATATKSTYLLKGNFTDAKNWSDVPLVYSDATSKISYAALQLSKGTYVFKLFNTSDSKWYGQLKGTSNQTYELDGNNDSERADLQFVNGDGTNYDVYVNLNEDIGGCVLFVFNESTKKLTLKYTPTLPDEGDIRAYVMLNKKTEWEDWLTNINHWKLNDNSAVANTHRDVHFIGEFGKDFTNNHYTVKEDTWDKGGGTWSYIPGLSTSIFLTPNNNWTQANARFAAYFFYNDASNNKHETWVSMTDNEKDGTYWCKIPSGYENSTVIFCRMNPGTSTNNWENKWNQTDDLLYSDRGTAHYNNSLYYVDMDADATNMQWVNNKATYYPSESGYAMGTPKNGYLYYMTESYADACGTVTDNLQEAPTKVEVKNLSSTTVTTTTVNTKLTLSATYTKNVGTAYKGSMDSNGNPTDQNLTFYATYLGADGKKTGTEKIVPATWTPTRPGKYKIVARLDDNYITTEASPAVELTVNAE